MTLPTVNTRQITPSILRPNQAIVAVASYQCDANDTSVDVATAGITVTLPQNSEGNGPIPGVTSITLLANADFNLSGGAENPLTPTDPLPIATGQSLIASYTETGWELSDLPESTIAVQYAQFYNTIPTGSGVDVAVNAPIPFPGTGPFSTPAFFTRADANSFVLAPGTYEVTAQASFSPAGQMSLALNGAKIPTVSYGQIGRATSTCQGIISCIIVIAAGSAASRTLSVINPGSHGTAINLTSDAGGDAPEGPVSATLTVKKLA